MIHYVSTARFVLSNSYLPDDRERIRMKPRKARNRMLVFRYLFKSKLLVLLLILCFFDALFTDIGLQLAFIQEANPFIRHIYEWHIIAYYLVKLIFPIALMLIYPYIRQKLWVQPCLTLTVIVYAAVNVYHFVWLSYGLTYLASPA
ncbi:DUF5658 family protein [Paenibacillus sp. LjRoot153]|uniref:DUF5658 family protein n=1 Tax=Paenibacillus sp. LjRoot153 TaxID=3342270 RepID=UPI003ECEF6A8